MCGCIPEIFELDEDLAPDSRCRRAARLFFSDGAALGQSAVSLGRAGGRRDSTGGCSASPARGRSTTLFGSIISAGFRPTGRFPAEEETAINGEWVEAPGLELFEALEASAGAVAAGGRGSGVDHEGSGCAATTAGHFRGCG